MIHLEFKNAQELENVQCEARIIDPYLECCSKYKEKKKESGGDSSSSSSSASPDAKYSFQTLQALGWKDGIFVIRMPEIHLEKERPLDYYDIEFSMDEMNGSVAKSGLIIWRVFLEKREI